MFTIMEKLYSTHFRCYTITQTKINDAHHGLKYPTCYFSFILNCGADIFPCSCYNDTQ